MLLPVKFYAKGGNTMEELGQFIKQIQLDQENNIVVVVEEQLLTLLQNRKVQFFLFSTAKKVLQDDFINLDIENNRIKIKVIEGTEEKNLERVRQELLKSFEGLKPFLPKK